MVLDATFNGDSDYYVMIKMFWYRNGATEGTARHGVDYYNELIPPAEPNAVGSCPGTYLE